MKNKLKIAWLWCKNHWKGLCIALGVLLTLLGFLIFSNEKSFKLDFRKLDLSKKKQEAAKLKGKKEILQVNREANQEEIAKIEDALSSIEKEIALKQAKINQMTLKQKLDKFNDLGY